MPVSLEMLSDAARLPLRARRRAVRLLWRTLRLAGRLPELGAEDVLKFLLHVSNAEAKRLDREIIFQDMMVTGEWGALLKRSLQGISRDCAAIEFRDHGIFRQVSLSAKPIILAPIHMGAFALPFGRIMHDYFRDRRMLILRAREDRPEETLAMKRISEIGVDMRFLNVAEKQNYLDAVRFAKDGAVVVVFADLPASYGGPVKTDLFGKRVQLAMGIGSLARLTGATVIPMSVHSGVDGDVVNISRPFETFEKGPDEKLRVTGIIRRHIEESIRAAPEQWHMWPRFNEFLDLEPESEAA